MVVIVTRPVMLLRHRRQFVPPSTHCKVLRTVSNGHHPKPFDVTHLKDPETGSQFRSELPNHFEALAQGEDTLAKSHWDWFRSTVVNGAAASIGRRLGTFSEQWIQRDTWDLIDERNKAKQVRDQEPLG